MAACALGIGLVRPWLADHYHELRRVDDVYALPSPQQTVGISLGYRAALADLIYANTLVAYGIRTEEGRPFEFAGNYLETCIALDPKLREVYYFADTLLTLQTIKPRREDFYEARRIQERGREEFPYDPELWLVTGQFLAYLAPGQLDDVKERIAWRTEGARVMARACELAAGDGLIMRKCVAAASTLTREGEREAVVRMLERVLALSSDDETRRRARGWLEKIGHAVPVALIERQTRLSAAQSGDLPFLSHELYVLLGPPYSAPACAGRSDAVGCATSWPDWFREPEISSSQGGTAP